MCGGGALLFQGLNCNISTGIAKIPVSFTSTAKTIEDILNSVLSLLLSCTCTGVTGLTLSHLDEFSPLTKVKMHLVSQALIKLSHNLSPLNKSNDLNFLRQYSTKMHYFVSANSGERLQYKA